MCWRASAERSGCETWSCSVPSTSPRTEPSWLDSSSETVTLEGMNAEWLVHAAAHITRRVHPRGIDRALRLLHPPHHRGDWSVRCCGRLPGGALLHVDTARFIEWTVFFYGGYEPQLERIVRDCVTERSVAVDIGANIGVHSLQMASRATFGTVLSFEPNPLVFPRLMANLELNGLKNVRARQLAVSDVPGQLTFSFPAADASNQATGAVNPEGSTSVRAVTLDEQVRVEGLDRVDFMKVDVEGWESSVLAGAERTLSTYRPVLVFEYSAQCWSNAGGDLGTVLELLERCGYRRFHMINQRRAFTPKLERRRSPAPLDPAHMPAAGNILARA